MSSSAATTTLAVPMMQTVGLFTVRNVIRCKNFAKSGISETIRLREKGDFSKADADEESDDHCTTKRIFMVGLERQADQSSRIIFDIMISAFIRGAITKRYENWRNVHIFNYEGHPELRPFDFAGFDLDNAMTDGINAEFGLTLLPQDTRVLCSIVRKINRAYNGTACTHPNKYVRFLCNREYGFDQRAIRNVDGQAVALKPPIQLH